MEEPAPPQASERPPPRNRSPSPAPSGSSDADEVRRGGEDSFSIAAVTAGAALVVSVFAAIGVSGEILTRAVRNDADGMAAAVLAVLVVTALTAAWQLWRRSRALGVSAILVGAALVWVVIVGTQSLERRERPHVAVASESSDGLTRVTVRASASGLRSEETMLVQVQGVETYFEEGVAGRDPATLTAASGELGCNRTRFPFTPPALREDWLGPLLLWEQAGPDPSGSTAVESVIEFSTGTYEGVCTLVALENRSDGSRPLRVRAYLRVPEETPQAQVPVVD